MIFILIIVGSHVQFVKGIYRLSKLKRHCFFTTVQAASCTTWLLHLHRSSVTLLADYSHYTSAQKSPEEKWIRPKFGRKRELIKVVFFLTITIELWIAPSVKNCRFNIFLCNHVEKFTRLSFHLMIF